MKLNELNADAYKHAYHDVYGAGNITDRTPAENTYRELCDEMQDIIDSYCTETGATVKTPRVWGSMFYDLSFDEMNIYAGDETTPTALTLPGCDSDNAYALCEYVNGEMKERYASAAWARFALDCIAGYEDATDYKTQEWNMCYDEIACIDAFNDVMNERNRMFARAVVDYDDGNATYAYSEDAFETWAWDKDFDANGDLIA